MILAFAIVTAADLGEEVLWLATGDVEVSRGTEDIYIFLKGKSKRS